METSFRKSIFFVSLFFLAACQGKSSNKSQASLDDCPGEAHSHEVPSNFDEVVEVINQLPKPLTVPCFVNAFKGPLALAATSNEVSAQPATGPDNPRIFILTPTLSISVATDGPGKENVEFGFVRSTPSRTVKADISFPIEEEIKVSDLFEEIQFGNGTDCRFCHRGERSVEDELGPGAFESDGIRPSVARQVTLEDLITLGDLCEDEKTYRCDLLRALLSRESLSEGEFPEDMQEF